MENDSKTEAEIFQIILTQFSATGGGEQNILFECGRIIKNIGILKDRAQQYKNDPFCFVSSLLIKVVMLICTMSGFREDETFTK